MVELTLPKNSKVGGGKRLEEAVAVGDQGHVGALAAALRALDID